jgi:hypothetical protein
MPKQGRKVQCRCPVAVSDIDLGSSGQKQLGDAYMPFLGSSLQWRTQQPSFVDIDGWQRVENSSYLGRVASMTSLPQTGSVIAAKTDNRHT